MSARNALMLALTAENATSAATARMLVEEYAQDVIEGYRAEIRKAVNERDLGPRGGMSEDYENGWWDSLHATETRLEDLATAAEGGAA